MEVINLVDCDLSKNDHINVYTHIHTHTHTHTVYICVVILDAQSTKFIAYLPVSPCMCTHTLCVMYVCVCVCTHAWR